MTEKMKDLCTVLKGLKDCNTKLTPKGVKCNTRVKWDEGGDPYVETTFVYKFSPEQVAVLLDRKQMLEMMKTHEFEEMRKGYPVPDEDEPPFDEDKEETLPPDICEVDRIWHSTDKKTGLMTTVVKWLDGTKTKVTDILGTGNDWGGFCSAVTKRVYGGTSNAIAQKEYGEARGFRHKK